MNKQKKKEHNRKYKEKHREEAKLYARNFRKEGRSTRDKQRQKEVICKWEKKYPERRKAHRKVYYALKTGKLKKEPCKVCRSEKVHAHHEDYSKPLEVIWLCPIHHYEYDQKINRRINH